MQRKYFILFILIVMLVPVILFFLQPRQLVAPSKQYQKTSMVTPEQQNRSIEYVVMDQSVAPKTANSVTSGKVLREESQRDGHTWQRFVIVNQLDGSGRELLNTIEDGKIFEKIEPQNWSPTNRWLFVLNHDDQKQDILLFKTDGTFTTAKYHRYPTQLYSDWSIESAEWVNSETLTLQAINIKTHVSKKFIVDFDDDTGNMIPDEKN
jgi:hypothetical protein